MKICKVCRNLVIGRADKIFCSVKCKNFYHLELRAITAIAASDIDKILHRNRSILSELIGGNKRQVKIKRLEMDKKNFHFKYQTHKNINSKGKTYNWLYDLGWMEFSNDEILLLKKRL
ncbi:hypothetical protein ERX46_11480 [Brumimicrobium glaciale]|uniref:DUF2116 family Zn-ribbon domain-containing protein n=1 Tax=Brumimicrobium glaciale TaxID=200475 RepID=A0A4Q4KJV9_9FLAO|nr:hypothetical protein [Brumimicrobium glaciale]RYM33552.1 hypothetical protein ERX46_11480 [Brumimicrobium glaciale]